MCRRWWMRARNHVWIRESSSARKDKGWGVGAHKVHGRWGVGALQACASGYTSLWFVDSRCCNRLLMVDTTYMCSVEGQH